MKENSVVVLAPAKINLALAVNDIRADGYHSLETVFQSVSLFDRVEITLQGGGISCLCGELSGEKNLAYQAAGLFLDEYKTRTSGAIPGVEIKIEKHIPLQAGLAGGSSDAAAVLIGLNRLLSNPFSYEHLVGLAKQCGSDTAFCLLGGTAWGEGTGSELQELPPAPEMDIILVKPEQGVSTADAYRLFDKRAEFSKLNQQRWVSVLSAARIDTIGRMLSNDLENIVFDLVPKISVLKRLLLEGGCLGALMSGSGSTMFGIVKDYSQGEKMRKVLAEKGYHQTWLVKTIGSRNINLEKRSDFWWKDV
ncbi:MAG: 4-(cytidine 5'-diphospho)-2-C-methyl-D-erythritol kinase [Dehalobacter sp. 4CP]|uniref:4-(cytidine 5'-diphospho)-2-C-methyl-D-erythritol kinase n=1 Tax=Dehalobacter sp. CP TaxID=2594474 RepID=UPI0013CB7135|nr:4-(cytidine 5'-diphospho)-2-C-methyl-D-erythritol kinase [Dehalobacter sp.]NBJ16089.1 4-(cytidine 5'-diphospho)-2-C-methyl-D-erythritol kinase [Dehalobacter sp. 4CP]